MDNIHGGVTIKFFFFTLKNCNFPQYQSSTGLVLDLLYLFIVGMEYQGDGILKHNN